jgi:hypothetical protein
MPISSTSSVALPPAVPKTPAVSQNARAADGDYLAAGPGRSTLKDADGDYKPIATQASNAVQTALTGIKLGG